MQGNGGRSQIGNGAVVRGAGFTMPNPVAGNPVGIVCGQTVIDSALYSQFVKIRNTRDPDLKGGLTLNGALPNTFTLDVNGTANIAGGITTGAHYSEHQRYGRRCLLTGQRNGLGRRQWLADIS